jgi:23S rRNA pseudouridine2605 synthase
MPERRHGEVSLARAISKLGGASRAEAARLIASGRVTVDGERANDPARPVVPERIEIRIDGGLLAPPRFRLVAFHKPRSVVTTRRDPEGRKTVFELLGPEGRGLLAVGRLDFATSGLLLLTNDSQLANALTDPANAVPRVYLATVRGRWSDEKSLLATEGVVEGGDSLRAAEVVARKVSGRESHLVLTLLEGKNREIRRLLTAVGHEVTRLKRVRFGLIELGDLAPGSFRDVPGVEVVAALGAWLPEGTLGHLRESPAGHA